MLRLRRQTTISRIGVRFGQTTLSRIGVRLASTAKPAVGHSGHLSADAMRNRHDVPATDAGLSHKQKYMFDLNGFLVLKRAFPAEMVQRANAAIDASTEAGQLHERAGQLRTSGLYGRESTALAGDGSTGRFDMGGMLGWEHPHRRSKWDDAHRRCQREEDEHA